MKLLKAAALVFLFLSCSAASARDVQILGSGTRKCSDWLEWKAAQNGEARAMAAEWARGFISGHNVFARKGAEPANSVVVDVKVLATLLDAFCQKNQQARIFEGIIDATQSLGGAKINIAPKAPSSGPLTKPQANGPSEL